MKRKIINREFSTFSSLIKRCTLTNEQITKLLTKSGLDIKIDNKKYNVKILNTHEQTFVLCLNEYKEEKEILEDDILKEKIMQRMLECGYEESEIDVLENLIGLYEDDIQFKEAIDNEYAMWDYDNWMDLQRVMGIVLDYKTAMNVLDALNREDITIAQLTDNKNEITEEKKNEYYESDRHYFDTPVRTDGYIAKDVEIKVSNELRKIDIKKNDKGNLEFINIGSVSFELLEDELEFYKV